MNNNSRRITGIIAAVIVVALIIAFGIYRAASSHDASEVTGAESIEKNTSYKSAVDRKVRQDGKRPSDKRLREGAERIETYSRAQTAAAHALQRVEKELAEAQDEETRQRLMKKKELIQKAMANVEDRGEQEDFVR